jgi:Putative prokaryotic signal transducing protein
MKWVKLANYGSGFDADVTVERLRSAGLHARAGGGDSGMFGAGFKGPTARGIDVYVLDKELAAARDVLEEMNEAG